MAGRIASHFIDDLLTRIDIVDVVQRRLSLKKAGGEWTACCPFHDERTPSFTVSPQKQFYHCFGCGAHGSAVGFVMEYDHLEFPDAVEELAQDAGMEVQYENGSQRRDRDDRSDLYTLLDEAANWYQKQLSQSEQAQTYCRERGLDADTLERFRIGWAPPGWDGIHDLLGTSQARVQALETSGMLSTGRGGKRYDRFRKRLMFPIPDRRGRIVAFGGRVLDPEDSPKYLNSPETPLFHKGRELFGLWQVKQVHKQPQRVVVVEGYMDVIALHQAGLPIAVATLGTATTPEQMERLFRTTGEVVFCFDGDRAGRDAAWKALQSALPNLRDGRQAAFLLLDGDTDPDTLVRSEGKDGFQARLAAATPLSTYLFDTLAADVDTHSIDGRARLAEQARPLLARLPDSAFRDLMQQELEKRTGVSTRASTPPPAPRRAPSTSGTGQPTLIRSAITVLLADPTLAGALTPPFGFEALDKPGVNLLLELLETARTHPSMHTAALLAHFEQHQAYPHLRKLAAQSLPEGIDLVQEFEGALTQLQRQATDQRIAVLMDQQTQGQLEDAGKDELRQLLRTKGER